MKIAEFVKIGTEMLKLMSEYDVRIDDWKYLKMYDEYKRMRENHIKYRAAILELAISHNLSRSTCERIIRRLDKDVK